MPKVKQPNSWKVQRVLYEYASEFASTPKGELFCKFAKWKVTKGSWWKHITTVQSINEVGFMKLKVSQTFLKHAMPDFADKLLFVSFQ